jgi:hypothetical protein
MRFASLVCVVSLASVVVLGGCKSRYIEATVHNGSGAAVSVMEVDYPSASFGKETLADGADFHYRFKIQGDGSLKVMWTDAANHDHSIAGPQLNEGDEGTLRVTILPNDAKWDVTVKR